MDRVTICVYIKNLSDELEEKTEKMIEKEVSQISFIASNLCRVAISQGHKAPLFSLWLWLVPLRDDIKKQRTRERKAGNRAGDEDGIENRSKKKQISVRHSVERAEARARLFMRIRDEFSQRFTAFGSGIHIDIVDFAEYVSAPEVNYLLNVATSGGNLADIMKLKALMHYQLMASASANEADIVRHLQLDSTTLIRDYTLFYQMTFGNSNASNCQFLINVYSDDLLGIEYDKAPSQPTFSINNKIVYVAGNHRFLRFLTNSYREFMRDISYFTQPTGELVLYRYVFLVALKQAGFLDEDSSINFKLKNTFLITKYVFARRLQSWKSKKDDLESAVLTLDEVVIDVDCDAVPIIQLDYAAFTNLLFKHTVPLHHDREKHQKLFDLYADVDVEHKAIGVFIQGAIRDNGEYRVLLLRLVERLWASGSGIHRPTSHQLACDMRTLLCDALNEKRNYLAAVTPKKASNTSLKRSASMSLSLGPSHVVGVFGQSSPDMVNMIESISFGEIDVDVQLPSAGDDTCKTSEGIRQSIMTFKPANLGDTSSDSSSRLFKDAPQEGHASDSIVQGEAQVLRTAVSTKQTSQKISSKMIRRQRKLRESDLDASVADSRMQQGVSDPTSIDAVVDSVESHPTRVSSFVNPTSVPGTMHGAQQHQHKRELAKKTANILSDCTQSSVLGKK
jgi:hypothetical protein